MSSNTKLIAFYLPQYHPIPENDQWWGKGFTEWTNVSKAKPLFPGHYQPQLPADLGFYDLRLPEAREAQSNLAREYGISGFCYYHYWFNDRMILERPFNEVLESGKPDFPFCLCWANENWSRRWDGSEQQVLLEQKYDDYDPIKHINWLEKAFRDSRYIRINGKPLILVYKPLEIKNISQVLSKWREYLVDRGYPGLYICSVRRTKGKTVFSHQQLVELGFDANVDFQPDAVVFKKQHEENMIDYMPTLIERVSTKIISILFNVDIKRYASFVKRSSQLINNNNKNIVFPCVFPAWDNTSRRGKGCPSIIQNNSAELYGKWLLQAINQVNHHEPEEQLVFINAWNEWAEGCHLEPDLKHKTMFLEQTKKCINAK